MQNFMNRYALFIVLFFVLFSKINAQTVAQVLVVGGGGSGGVGRGTLGGGGGGAGGVVFSNSYTLTASSYSVTVGEGGQSVTSYGPTNGNNGQNSIFGTMTAVGGGGGGSDYDSAPLYNGSDGGSGGGSVISSSGVGMAIQTPQANSSSYYGNNGGVAVQSGPGYPAGGGGGAGSTGFSPNLSGYPNKGGNGGAGVTINFVSGYPTGYFAAGGGGSGGFDGAGGGVKDGGVGGSGIGGDGNGGNLQYATAGQANTGSGGGGGGWGSGSGESGAGGSGVVIIQYPGMEALYEGGTITITNGYVIHTFTSSGTFRIPPPTFGNPGSATPVNICENSCYYLNPSTTEGTWLTTNPMVATVNSSGYVAGVSSGTTDISLTVRGATATVTVNVLGTAAYLSSPTQTVPFADGRVAFKFTGSPQGPVAGSETVNYIGYNGYAYNSQIRPTAVGFYKSNIQSGSEAGCPNEFYIFNCTSCDIPCSANAGTLTGTQTIDVSSTTTFSTNGELGGTWSSANTAIATVNPSSGLVTGTGLGITTISYTVPGAGGCSNAVASRTIAVGSVTIGTQVWMNKNLDVSTYRDGTSIPQVTNNGSWTSTSSGAWSWYNNDATIGATYGKLYNGYAIRDPRGLCPVGWHIPSTADFNTLISFLGGDAVAPGKLKATSTWVSAGTNESGFSALAAGYRNMYSGDFHELGSLAAYAAGVSTSTHISIFYLMVGSPYILNAQTLPNRAGFSVRCIKD